MPLPDYPRMKCGSWQKFKASASGNDAAFTPSTLASGSYWQSAKMDLAAQFSSGQWPQLWKARCVVPYSATQTAKLPDYFFLAFSPSSVATTENPINLSGSDATYTGYSGGTAASAIVQLGRPLITLPVS